jgi:hypothetical protein
MLSLGTESIPIDHTADMSPTLLAPRGSVNITKKTRHITH